MTCACHEYAVGMPEKSSIAVTTETRQRLRQLAEEHFPGKTLNDVLALILEDFEHHLEERRRRYLDNENLMAELQRRRDEADEKGWRSTEDILAYLATRMNEEQSAA